VRILFFINSLRSGGAERVLVNLVNNLNLKKYNITVLTLFDTGINRQFLRPEISYKFVFKNRIFGIKYLYKLFSPTILYQYFVKDDYDLAVSYLQGFTTRIISGGPKLMPKVAWIHGTFSKKNNSKMYRSSTEMINVYNKYNAIVGVSKYIIDSFHKEIGKKENTYVIYNTHEVNKIINQSKESIDCVFDENKLNIITAGSFYPVKGYERLLKCILKLKIENYKFHLYLIGTGDLKESLEFFVKTNKLDDYVSFLGFQTNPYKYFSKADLFVCSSYTEGFSGTVSEATILGLPTLTTECSGMDEILGEKNEYGIIVNNSDEELYKGLKNILDNPAELKYYKEKVKERSVFFNTEATVKQAENLFDSLICKIQNNV